MTLLYDYSGDDILVSNLLSVNNLNQETAGYSPSYKENKKDNANPEAYRYTQSARFQSRIEKQGSNGSLFIFTPYARYTSMDFTMHYLPGDPLEENGQKGLGFQSSFTQPISRQFTLTTGFDSEYTDAYVKQTQKNGFSVFPAGQQYDFDVTGTLYAAFMSGHYQLTEATAFAGGARYEHLKYDYTNNMLVGNTDQNGDSCMAGGQPVPCRYSRPASGTNSFGNWSVNAELVHDINDSLAVVSKLSHGFRTPQANELYRLQGDQTDVNLDPEELSSIEAGLRGSGNSLSYSLTAFYMEKNNVILQSSERANINDGQTLHRGIEFGGLWAFAEHWDLQVAGTVVRHSYGKNVPASGTSEGDDIKGNDVDTAPRHMGSVQLGWQLPRDSRAELEWVHVGKYYTDITNEHSYEGYDLLNLRFRQDVNDWFSYGLRLTNLADKDYAERADYSAFSGPRYFVGEPRSLYGDISFRF